MTLGLGEVFGCEAWEPGIVGVGEGGAAADGGVVVGPAFEPEGWVGVVERGGAEDLEGGLSGGLGVRDEVVDGFLAVDVGRVFLGATDGGVDGFEEGGEDGEK